MFGTDTRVGAVMSTQLWTIEQNEKLAEADEVMRARRVRHLLAVDEEGALTGVLSQRDIYHGGLLKALGYGTRAKQKALEGLLVKEAMTADPVTASPEMALRDAARLMVERKLGCLPVVDAGRLVGILTESDFARLAAGLAPGGHAA